MYALGDKLFRDPVHQHIIIDDPLILKLIDTPEFQRLRRIKQLGTTSLVYHGAEHSRFSHSLGVYEITRRICDIFEKNYPKSKRYPYGWNASERQLTLCAALLHDIGHGPFSHAFEHIFNTHHEEMTLRIILSPDTQIHQLLKTVAPNFPEKVAAVIQKKYPNPQVVQLISSQIDSDRMDYLLRDAYFTGAEYGTFDLTRILRVIQPFEGGIGIHNTGMHAVEDYIMSRYQMYMQVYLHPVSRGMEVILDHLLKRAHFIYQNNSEQFEQFTPLIVPFLNQNHKYHLNDYLALDDTILMSYFIIWQNHNDPILKDLAFRFVNRRPFTSLSLSEHYVSDKKCYQQNKIYLQNITEAIQQQGLDTHYYTAMQSEKDLPYDFYKPASDETPIYLLGKDSKTELSQKSPLVKSLVGLTYHDKRFYFPKDKVSKSIYN